LVGAGWKVDVQKKGWKVDWKVRKEDWNVGSKIWESQGWSVHAEGGSKVDPKVRNSKATPKAHAQEHCIGWCRLEDGLKGSKGRLEYWVEDERNNRIGRYRGKVDGKLDWRVRKEGWNIGRR